MKYHGREIKKVRMEDFGNWPPRKRYYYEIYKDGEHIGNASDLSMAKDYVDSGYWETYWENLSIKGANAMKSDKVKKYYIISGSQVLPNTSYDSLEEAFEDLKKLIIEGEKEACEIMDRSGLSSFSSGLFYIDVRYE